MTDKSAIQRIKELDQERAALFEQAKEEAFPRATPSSIPGAQVTFSALPSTDPTSQREISRGELY
jgi:hypothetical protein